jgi:hypothetical protein
LSRELRRQFIVEAGVAGWSKNRTEKNRTNNFDTFDTFLDITFLLLELF